MGGVKSQATKKKLLSEDRTSEQALKVAQADELAEKQSKQLQQSNSNLSAKVQAVHSVPKKSSPAHPVNKQQSATTGKPHAKFCFRCESTQHLANKCSHSTSVCNFCKKKGHIGKVFFKTKKEGSCYTTHLVAASPTQEVNTTEGDGDTPDHFTVYMRSVKSSDSPIPTPPLYKLSVTVDSKEIPLEIDTGSAVTLLSATDFSKLGCHIETLKSPTGILKSYTGNIIECLGEKEMEFKIGDQLDSLLVRVVKGPSILGRDLMAKFKLPWQNIFQTVSTTTGDIVSQYPNLFDNTTVGKLKGIQVSL